jgi:hypothetical protein
VSCRYLRAQQGVCKRAAADHVARDNFLENVDENQRCNEISRDVGTENERNTICIFCNEIFSKSKPGEEWATCSSFKTWAHTDCSTYDGKTEKALALTWINCAICSLIHIQFLYVTTGCVCLSLVLGHDSGPCLLWLYSLIYIVPAFSGVQSWIKPVNESHLYFHFVLACTSPYSI